MVKTAIIYFIYKRRHTMAVVDNQADNKKEVDLCIENIPPHLFNERGLILDSLKQDGLALQYASPEYKRDKEAVVIAVQSNVAALTYVDENLKRDKEFMLRFILPILKQQFRLGTEMMSIRDLIECKSKLRVLPVYFSSFFITSERKIADVEKIMNLYYNQGIYTIDFLEQLPENIKKKMKIGSHLNDILHLLEYHYYGKQSIYELELAKLQVFIKRGFIPSSTVFHKVPYDKVDMFDKSKWFQMAGFELFQGSEDSKAALVEFIFVFGLFEKDEQSTQRMETLKKMIHSIPKTLKIEELEELKKNGVDTNLILSFYKKSKQKYYQVNALNSKDYEIACNLPNQVEEGSLKSRLFHLNRDKIKSAISTEDYQVLLKHAENFYSKEWLHRVFTPREEEVYELSMKPSFEEQQKIAAALLSLSNPYIWNKEKLNRMFKGTRMEFNPKLYVFFIQNYADILEDEEYQRLTPMIINHFNEVSYYYQKMAGKITLDGFRTYARGVNYIDIPHGYQEFALLCNRSGVSESNFHKLIAIREKQRKRKVSTIPRVRVETIIQVNQKEQTIYGEIKRLDDPIALVIGEEKFSNCCQVLGKKGEPCMVHLATDKTGRLFCVYDGENRLLAQSWVWRNGDTICFDNVERSNLLFDEESLYKDAVFQIYELAAHALVKESKKNITSMLNEPSLYLNSFDYKVLKERLEKTRVKHVTVGDTRYGFAMNRYFKQRMPMPKVPLHYDPFHYVDSYNQVIIYSEWTGYGRETEVLEEYFDERLVHVLKGKEITSDMIFQIKQINPSWFPIYDVVEMESIYQTNFNNIELILGEDWYILFERKEDQIQLYSVGVDANNKKSLEEQKIALEQLQRGNCCTQSDNEIQKILK